MNVFEHKIAHDIKAMLEIFVFPNRHHYSCNK